MIIPSDKDEGKPPSGTCLYRRAPGLVCVSWFPLEAVPL